MKPVFAFFSLVIFSFSPRKAMSQKTLTEAVLTYNISIETLKGEKPVTGSLNGAVLTVYLTKDKSRTEMQSAPGTEAVVYDNISGKGYILKEYSGQKLMITMTQDNWKMKNKLNEDLNFSTDAASAIVNGYTVKKAVASGGEKTYTVYYDPTVSIVNKNYNNAFSQLPGLPVQFELQSGNLIFRYTLVKYNPEIIPAAKFDAPKTGFRVMTYEDNQQLKKGD